MCIREGPEPSRPVIQNCTVYCLSGGSSMIPMGTQAGLQGSSLHTKAHVCQGQINAQDQQGGRHGFKAGKERHTHFYVDDLHTGIAHPGSPALLLPAHFFD